MIISCEMARMSMKIHAYFREKMVFAKSRKNDAIANYIPDWAAKRGITIDDLDKPDIDIRGIGTELKRFLYFFFVPTLVYRDKYIQTKRIRIHFVLQQAFTFCFLILYLWAIFTAIAIPAFKDTVSNPSSVKQFIHSVFSSMISGIICLLTIFYGVLHTWFNLHAELFMFADRCFYEDWWNVKEFAEYYRKWNIVVHEFLYYYVYQDILRFSKGKIKAFFAKIFVFSFSALVHEVIVTCSMGFFFPLLFVMFGGPGVIFTQFKFGTGPYSGTIFWFFMLIGCGLLMTIISREYVARNAPGAMTFTEHGL